MKKSGITRDVYLVGKYAVKIPCIWYNHYHFLTGCKDNWAERRIYKIYTEEYKKKLAPSLWCSWFGIIQIQKKCEPLGRDLTEKEKKYFDITTDLKKENFGWFEGRVVCVDYA